MTARVFARWRNVGFFLPRPRAVRGAKLNSRGLKMEAARVFERYQELQLYVGWTESDRLRIVAAAPLLEAVSPRADRRFLRRDRTAPQRAQGDHGRAGPDRAAQGDARAMDSRSVRRRNTMRITWRGAGGSAGGTSRSASTRSIRTSRSRGYGPDWSARCTSHGKESPWVSRRPFAPEQTAGSGPGDHRRRVSDRVHGAVAGE